MSNVSTIYRVTSPVDVLHEPHKMDSLQPPVVATVVICVIVTTLLSAARLVSKRSLSPFNVEDYLSMVMWFFYIGFATLILIQGELGLGQHVWNIRPENVPEIVKINWVIEIFYNIVSWMAKLALLFQLQRALVPDKTGAVYIVCQILIWTVSGFYFSTLMAVFVQCVPTQRIWQPGMIEGRCLKVNAILVATDIIELIGNIAILILPVWASFHLQIAPRKKRGVAVLLFTGVLACVAAVCRLTFTFPALHDEDMTYHLSKMIMWSIAEVTCIILCTCFPLMCQFVYLTVCFVQGAKPTQEVTINNEKRPASSYRPRISSRYVCKACITRGVTCANHKMTSESTTDILSKDGNTNEWNHTDDTENEKLGEDVAVADIRLHYIPSRTSLKDALSALRFTDDEESWFNDAQGGSGGGAGGAAATAGGGYSLNANGVAGIITVRKSVQVEHGVRTSAAQKVCRDGREGAFSPAPGLALSTDVMPPPRAPV